MTGVRRPAAARILRTISPSVSTSGPYSSKLRRWPSVAWSTQRAIASATSPTQVGAIRACARASGSAGICRSSLAKRLTRPSPGPKITLGW